MIATYPRVFFLAAGLMLASAASSAQMLVSTGTGSGARFYYTGGADWWLDPSQGRFDLRVNGGASPVISVLSGGNLGIGTANPGYKLDVNGPMNASSATLNGASGTYDLLLSTGIYLSAGEIKFNGGAGGISWPDGTRSTSASSGSSPSVGVSSFGIIASQTISATATNVCVPGSTRTFTPTQSQIDIINFMSADQGNSGQDCGGTALLDGAYLPGWVSGQVIRAFQNAYIQNFSWTIPSVPVTAHVSHTVCLVVVCGSSGPSICAAGPNWTTKCLFGARDAMFTAAP